jgi:1-acyl-sn-glycerol-3-phosphate acyltransferase
MTSARRVPHHAEPPPPGPGVTHDGKGEDTLLGMLADLFRQDLDPSDMRNRDVAFAKKLAPLLYAIGMRYFRAEGEGFERLPADGQYIGVGNHSGPPLLPDVCVLAAWWVLEMGLDRPTYIMVHDFPFRIPVLKNLMSKVGALPASRENAERVLGSGASMLCYPGGELDCLRSFRDRNRVQLYGRTGFVKLAFKYGVPIIPFVNIGGQEVYFTLFSSQRLARWTGLEKFARVKSVPLILGLPWGLWFTGFLPYLPLPSKLVYKVGAPIRVQHDPDRANDRDAVQRVYRQVTEVMQEMLDDLASRRRFPVIG